VIIYIISGEGEQGTREVYKGKRTVRALKSRMTRERQGGDRWVRIEIEGERVTPEEAIYRTLAEEGGER